MTDVYGHSAPSYSTDAKRVAGFKDPARIFEDAPRSARPPTALTDERVRTVEEVVMRDRQISIRRVADELTIFKTSLYEIMSRLLVDEEGLHEMGTEPFPITLTCQYNRLL